MVTAGRELLHVLRMKILIILATGTLLTFSVDERTNPDCFSQGHKIMEKISTYQYSGTEQGWYLNDCNIQVAGFYCD